MAKYDRGSKWLFRHMLPSMLTLAGYRQITRFEYLPNEISQPLQVPDGLCKLWLPEWPQPALALFEVVTYPKKDTLKELLDDLATVWLDQGSLPDVIVFVLASRGRYQLPKTFEVVSPSGKSKLRGAWDVIRMDQQDGEALVASGDQGLMPWAVLAHSTQPRELFVRHVRQVLDREPDLAIKERLLLLTQVFLSLRYNVAGKDAGLLDLLGGGNMFMEALLESPVLREWRDTLLKDTNREWETRLAETGVRNWQQSVLGVLQARFGPPPEELVTRVQGVADIARLEELVAVAARCADWEAFQQALGEAPTAESVSAQ